MSRLTTKTVVIVLQMIVMACLWGSFAWFYRQSEFPWEFDVFVWSLVLGVTINGLFMVFHVTRWHYGEHHVLE